MSVKGLEELDRQGLLCGHKINSLEFCENCIFGKADRAKFPKGVHISKCISEYVHSDLWGPAQVPSLSRGRYFVTLIDDYSRKVWLDVLKSKNQALEKFKVWKTLVENQSGKREKTLRTNNGLEFYNKEVQDY